MMMRSSMVSLFHFEIIPAYSSHNCRRHPLRTRRPPVPESIKSYTRKGLRFCFVMHGP